MRTWKQESGSVKIEPVGGQALKPKDTIMVIRLTIPQAYSAHQQDNGGVYEEA